MDDGVYCSTAGTYFNEREALSEHYQSEFHRYNLKRKIAGLPPVTREWYEARRAQLSATTAGPLQRVWFDPLTKKKFYSENTYLASTRSKKYQELVRKSGQPAPAAIVTVRRLGEGEDGDGGAAPARQPTHRPAPAATVGFTIKPAVRGGDIPDSSSDDEGGADADSGSAWETASEEEMSADGGAEWEEWDVCRSLFDNNQSATMEENLEYMWRKYGFYLPDSEYLVDPEGLIKYLGAKLAYGHIPLYESGNNPNAKQMASLHGAQRHMVDVGKCKLLYDGNEDEYADFYDYDKEGVEGGEGAAASTSRALILGDGVEGGAVGGFELSVAGPGGNVRMLGAREFSRYYRQRHRAGDTRGSALVARVVSQYRKLAVPLLGDGTEAGVARVMIRRGERAAQRAEGHRLAASMRRNVNDNLPKNVPY